MTHTLPSVIGIDISKVDFVVSHHGASSIHTYPNSHLGWEDFYKSIKRLQDVFVVLEVTGGYEMGLLTFLCDHDVRAHRADTRKVKNFIRSLGVYAKTDSCDAKALAQYGFERKDSLKIFRPNSAVLQELKALTLRRLDLKTLSTAEKNRQQAPESKPIQKSIAATLKCFKKQIALIEDRINSLIQEDEELKGKRTVLEEIPGVAAITSQGLLSLMPELGYLNRRQAAALAGVAPYANDSGKRMGYRSTRGGRRELRSVLFMAAFGCTRSRSRLGVYYRSLIERGKKPMVSLVALMRKIIVIGNAKLRDYIASQAT